MSALADPIGLMIMLTGVLVGAAAALPGCFLVLRGAAMLSDAIGHAIVLGIVLVWLATGATGGPVMVLGAAAAGLATVALTEALARTGLVAGDAAIGLVFPAFFALGVLLISLYGRNVHLDVDAVLLGEIGFVWLDMVSLAGVEMPRAVATLATVLVLNAAFVALFYKELKLASFDPGLAAALGFRPALLSYALLALVSITAVAAFEAVGAILFVVFVIVPAATAFLLTTRLAAMLPLAVGLAVAASLAGYPLAVRFDVSIAGMMALVAGGFFALALLGAPRAGLLAQRRAHAARLLDRDCRTLAVHLMTHRGTDAAEEESAARALRAHLRWPDARARQVILASLDRGFVTRAGETLALTEKGMAVARIETGAGAQGV